MSELIPHSRLMILPAAHGAYIGAAESPAAGNGLIEMTARAINNFLAQSR